MEMEDQYGISDLRQFISRAAVVGQQQPFPPYHPQPVSLPSSSDLFTAHHHHPAAATAAAHQHHQQQQQQYEMVVMSRNNMPPAVVAAADMLHLHNNSNTNIINPSTSSAFHLLPNNNNNSNKDYHHPQFNSDSTTTTATAATAANSGGFDGGDGGTARWPRQETLTLLEIRSRLDHKFKEANQKGPLWDEVARIMCEEHGYQRTGKKCREKFENLYKYYKKTKEGKAGRQDGKHYRFFRQLEALYGDHNNNNNGHHHQHHHSSHHHPITSENHHIPHFHNNNMIPTATNKLAATCSDQNTYPMFRANNTSISLSNTSDYDTSSSDNDVGGASVEESGDSKKKKRGKRSWKAKIKEFIDHQMRKIMDKQEAWLDKMMKTLESREMERIEREEEWRKQEGERIEREHKFWASERAWIEARDSALMTALEKLTNTREREVGVVIGGAHNADHRDRVRRGIHGENQWLETEVTRLVQLRTSMESRFQQSGFSEEVLWEDIAAKMAYLGYDRSAIVCKEKWDNISKYFQEDNNNNNNNNNSNNNNNNIIRDNEGNKKRKENYGEVSHNNHNNNNANSSHHNHNEGGLYMNHHHLGGFSNDNHNNANNCEINEPRLLQLNEGSSSSPSSHNSNANNVNVNVNVNASSGVAGGSVMNDSCLRFFLGDGAEGSLGWESSYGMKLNNKGGGNQCA